MRHTFRAAALLLAFAAAPAQAADPAACKVVRFADIGWTDVSATTALAGVILKRLGYTPRVSQLTVPATYQAMQHKDIDVFLGNWMPTMEADRKPFLDDKSVEVLGANLEGAKFTLAVPQYTYDKGLQDFADIEKFAKDLNFKIYGIEADSDGNQHLRDLIKAKRFGLDKFTVVEIGEQYLLGQLDKAYHAKRPIVFLGWQPHPMNKLYKIRYLTGGDDSFGPNFGEATVFTNVRAGYTQECPNAGKLIANLKFDLSAEDTMMDDILNREIDPTRAATTWLKANKAALGPWLDGVTTFDGKPGLAAVQGK